MNTIIDTVIIGAGQSGLAMSFWLKQAGHPHIVLEKSAGVGNAWRAQRWDSFTLVTPNRQFTVPGAEYDGEQPNGFMTRLEVIRRFETLAAVHQLPIQYETIVVGIERLGQSYRVQTRDNGSFEARNVVIAAGFFQGPKRPDFATGIDHAMVQLHSSEYKNPSMLPDGAVVVVGSGQSGTQIALELRESGREVFICTSSAGRIPRRYRGEDITHWLKALGIYEKTPDTLSSPNARFTPTPHLSGRNGGETINLHLFARSGITLLGRLRGAASNKIWLASDLKLNLAAADEHESKLLQLIDEHIERSGINTPREVLAVYDDGFRQPEFSELTLGSRGIKSIIWANGYSFDFSFVRAPVFDSKGFPIHVRGVTSSPGLYFLGLPWLSSAKSSLLYGAKDDAGYLASLITGRTMIRLTGACAFDCAS